MNRSAALLRLSCAAAVFALVGCQTPHSVRRVTATDAGSTIQLSNGDFLEVELDSNLTTGYTWQTVQINSWVLARVNRPDYVVSNPGTPGSGGLLTLTYQAVGPGESPLKLGYARPWETNTAAAKTFEIRVVVK